MKSLRSRITALFLTAASALVLGGAGCQQGQEGDRCNPSLSHDECGAGLSCQQPVDCPENYCCPKSGASSNPYCQPGCAGGQASICAAGGDADCPQAGDGGAADSAVDAATEGADDAAADSAQGDAMNAGADAPAESAADAAPDGMRD
jgi:hypothetical protein